MILASFLWPRRAASLVLVLIGALVLLSSPSGAQIPGIPGPRPRTVTQRTSPTVTGARLESSKTRPSGGEDDLEEEEAESAPVAPVLGRLRPFGANLFMGNFLRSREDGLNPEYVLLPGDHVALNIWGAVQVSEVFVVDGQGNIFIPQVGPIRLAGVKNSQLTEKVREGLSRVYTRYFDVYTNLITAKPVAVFVTGGVLRPGRYAGIPSDSALFFLDQAGGIAPELGSYRDIQILRGGQVLATIDLYEFILKGSLPDQQFKDGDTILVRQRGPVVELRGSVRTPALLEFKPGVLRGEDALAVVPEAARATEVTVFGLRRGFPFSGTYTLAEFRKLELADGDSVELRDDLRSNAILVRMDGEFDGPSMLAVQRGARLIDVLHRIPVDPKLANLDGVHLRRPSVAQAQKDAIHDALFRLERAALLGLSDSDGETNIRVKEADLVQRFVERARNIQPLGRVVTSRGNQTLNIVLEDGDTIVIPSKTNVVRISGEVFMAQAVMYTPGFTASDYIRAAGGFTDRADTGRVVIHHPNAQIVIGSKSAEVGPGDEILVPPRVDNKLTQNVMDITQIIYQVAVSAAVVLLLVN